MITLVSGLADVCCFPCGSNTLIAFGDTTVDVIMKKINSRNITSVMDAILKLGDILALRCNTFQLLIYLLLFSGFVQQVHECHCFGFHFIDHAIHQSHQIVIGKHGNDTHDQTAYGGDHGFVDTAGK